MIDHIIDYMEFQGLPKSELCKWQLTISNFSTHLQYSVNNITFIQSQVVSNNNNNNTG